MNRKVSLLLLLVLYPFYTQLLAFDIQEGLQQDVQTRHSYVPNKVWDLVQPYLMPDDHPLKKKLDKIFSETRVLHNLESLYRAGFENKAPQSHSKAIVIRHRDMKGYIFKIYVDSKTDYYRNEPEYVTWFLRARGAKLVREEIEKLGYQAYFKAPRKWIYALPSKPKARKGTLQKNFILVEDEMDTLSNSESLKKWKNGTITKEHLNMLFHIITNVGLRGGCRYDNVPICKDGRLAFIDTQNNLKWPLPYSRLYLALEGELSRHWEELIKSVVDSE